MNEKLIYGENAVRWLPACGQAFERLDEESLSSCFGVLRAVARDVAFLLTLVAGLVLVRVSRAAVGDGRAGCSQAVPSHMVRTSAAITLDRGQGGRVQGPSRGRRTRGKSTRASAVGAGACNVAKTTAVVTLLAATGLDPQTGALRLDVSNASARVALLSSDRAGLGASSRLVARLAAIVAETLLRRTIFRNVAQIATLETPLPGELERHPNYGDPDLPSTLNRLALILPTSFVRVRLLADHRRGI